MGLHDIAPLKEYIQHDGSKFKLFNIEPRSLNLVTNNTNKLYFVNTANIKTWDGALNNKVLLAITRSHKGLITEGILIYDPSMSKFTL